MLYVVLAGIDVLCVFAGWDSAQVLIKPLLIPALFAYFVVALDGLEHHLATWVKRALVFSWLGDVLLLGEGDAFFALGLLAFLAAQICYIRGFLPYVSSGVLANQPWLVVPYVAFGLGLVVPLAPGLGPLLLPVVLYAVALVTMAVLATGVSPLTGWGGALFLLSDSLIAMTELSDLLPASAASWIMPTYLLGQLLIVRGVLQLLGRSALRRVEFA